MFMSPKRTQRRCVFGLTALAMAMGCARLETVPVVGRFVPRPSSGGSSIAPAVGVEGGDRYAEMLARAHEQAGVSKVQTAALPGDKPTRGVAYTTPVEPVADDGIPAPLPAFDETPTPADDPAEAIRPRIEEARARLKTLSTYQVKLARQERVGGQLLPSEDVLVSIRREPRAARITWAEGPHKGREVIYRAEEPAILNVHMGDIAIPLTLKLPVDGPRVRESSRHPITEVGLEGVLDQLAGQVDRAKAEGDTLSLAPPAQVEGFAAPTRKVGRTTKAGERWAVLLDAETSVPVLVEGFDPGGLLLERYRFTELVAEPVELSMADAFDPSTRWPKAGGFLQRIGRVAP